MEIPFRFARVTRHGTSKQTTTRHGRPGKSARSHGKASEADHDRTASHHTRSPSRAGMWDPTYPRSATAIFLAFPALKSPAPLHSTPSINPDPVVLPNGYCAITRSGRSQSDGDDAGAAVAERRRRWRGWRGGVRAARGQGLLGRAAPQVRRPGRRRRRLQAAINAPSPQPQALVPPRRVGALRQRLQRVRGGPGAGRAQAPAQHRRGHEGRAAAAHHHVLLLRAEDRACKTGRAAGRGRRRALPRRAGADVEEDGGRRVQDVRGEAPEQPRAAHQRHGLADHPRCSIGLSSAQG